MPGETYNRTCSHTCKIPSTSEKPPVPTSLSTTQLHLSIKNFVNNCCFHNSTSSCFILNETSNMLQQQETLCFEYTNLRSHVQFQVILEQLLLQTMAQVIDALASISSRHGLLKYYWVAIKVTESSNQWFDDLGVCDSIEQSRAATSISGKTSLVFPDIFRGILLIFPWLFLIMEAFLFLDDKVLLVYFAGTKRLFSYVQQVEKAHKGCMSSQKSLNYKQCLCRAAWSISGKRFSDFPRSFCKILLNRPWHSYNLQLGFYHFFGQIWRWESLNPIFGSSNFSIHKIHNCAS